MQIAWLPIVFGCIAGAATLLGMWLVLVREEWARRNAVYFIAFAIGILLTTSFTEIIPEAMDLSPSALLIVLATFFVFYLLEHSIVAHHHHLLDHEERERHAPIEKLAFAGLALHSLVDGLAIGAGFEVSATLGILATVAVVLHEVPEGITAVALFLHAGYARTRAVALTAIVALATPFGAMLTVLLPGTFAPSFLGVLLAIAGGSFIYVAAADLIPETHHARHIPAIILMGVGLLVPLVVERLIA